MARLSAFLSTARRTWIFSANCLSYVRRSRSCELSSLPSRRDLNEISTRGRYPSGNGTRKPKPLSIAVTGARIDPAVTELRGVRVRPLGRIAEIELMFTIEPL